MRLIYGAKFKIALVFVLAFVLLLVFVFPFVMNRLNFRVSNTSPKNGSSIPIETPEIIITFSRELVSNPLPALSFDEDMPLIVDSYLVDKNKIIIKLGSLDVDQKYSFTIKGINSTDNKTIDSYKYSFKTKYVEFKKLDKKTQQASIEKDTPGQQDPIYSYLPYEDVNTSITARSSSNEAGQETIIISVVITLSKADLANDNGEAAFNKYKTSANNYLLGTGLDLKKYTISYKKQTF